MNFKKIFKSYAAAVGFLSIVPTGRKEILSPDEFGSFPAYFPAVGLLFGLAMFALWHLCALVLPPEPSAVLVVVLLVLLNRGFHLDGLADAADALFSHKSREQKFLILKDCHQGTFGVLAIVLDVLLKIQMVAVVAPLAPWALILWPVWSRLAVSVVCVLGHYATSNEGLSWWVVENSTWKELWVALGFTLILSLFGGVPALVTAGLAFGGGFIFWKIWDKALGGVTGDLLGATIELTEIYTIIFFFILIN